LDCANGSAYKVAPKVFEELGAEVFLIGASPDGTNINEDCGAIHTKHLVRNVKLYKADLGIAVDGDADRVVLVDEKGQTLDGDHIMAICGQHYLDKGLLNRNTVVATVMSNMGLDIALARHKGKVLRTKVGDRYVVEEMRKNNLNFGGEQSGHLVFRNSSTTGDGILAALSLLQIVIEKEQPLHELREVMEKVPQVVQSIEVQKKPSLNELPELDSLITKIENKLGTEGRVLFRYSGTENKARIMIEGHDRVEIESMAKEISEKTFHLIGSLTI
jgi:phosphoglucosamine mutase